jgi:hypothetical protein
MPSISQLRVVLFLALVVSVALFTGCGDDEASTGDGNTNSASGAPEVSAKALFIKAANKACREDARMIQKNAQRITTQADGESSSALARVVIGRAIAPGLEAQAEALRALEPPPGEAQKVEEVLTAIQATVADARQDPAAFVQQGGSFAGSSSAAAKYGLTACGHP